MKPRLARVLVVTELARPVEHFGELYTFLQVVIVDDRSHRLRLNQMHRVLIVLTATPERIKIDIFISVDIVVILELL